MFPPGTEAPLILDTLRGVIPGEKINDKASREERYLEVNYELAGRSRHSQGSPIF